MSWFVACHLHKYEREATDINIMKPSGKQLDTSPTFTCLDVLDKKAQDEVEKGKDQN